MFKNFKLLIMIIGGLLLGSLIILYIFKWSDNVYQIFFYAYLYTFLFMFSIL